MEPRLHRLRLFLLYSMVVLSRRRRRSCAPSSAVACGSSSFSGRVCRRLRLRGNHWRHSGKRILRSSSRMSCLSTAGEMLWSVKSTNAEGTSLVADAESMARGVVGVCCSSWLLVP
ncbi:hypothetical protein PVAP13_9NG011551 [Panicum virgatum]|uniref:Secreted protein n=1 Tax=Panicum virgatum TaxID=38727 RepID=A0A8T0MBN6_PANVG|nr:hypothetical protein PVAP13_9NG011551 [Panicum virgatum]